MHDRMTNGTPFRVLYIIDDFNREVLNITVERSIGAKRVIRELQQLMEWRGQPESLRFDNGPEFIATNILDFCRDNEIETLHIQPRKPNQNAYVERFNRSYHEDILDKYLFDNLHQVRSISQHWQWLFNNDRPHGTLLGMTPTEVLLEYGKRIEDKQMEMFSTFQQDDDDGDFLSIFY